VNLFFDEEAQRLIVGAKKEMYELKHPYVGSEHLLLSILNNRDLEITKFLNEYGITYDIFRNELIKVVGVGSKSNEWFLFTPLLKRIINSATYSSKDENRCVTPYNLFVSILQEGDGVANRILFGMNIDLDFLYDKFMDNNYSVSKYNKKLMLDELAINMNKECQNNKYDPVVGREEQISRVIQILLRKNKNNPILIGEAGVGKTAIVEEIVRKICNNDVPAKLKNKVIYNISMANLISGTKYRGEFEERFTKLISEIKNNDNIILFIDEIHTLMGAGGAEGAIDASNILKPFLARGDIKVIGATTLDEYAKFIEKDKAMDRRFQKVLIEEATLSEVREIIQKLVPIYEKFHGVKINNRLMELIIKLADKHIVKGKQPDKTIDFLDEVCCFAAIKGTKGNTYISELESKIFAVENEKNEEILKRNFKKALLLRQQEYSLRSKYNELLLKNDSFGYAKIVEEDLYNVLYNKTGIFIGSVFDAKVKGLKKKLKSAIYGQDKVIESFVSQLNNMFKSENNVTKAFLLEGKKGAGKTFFVETLVNQLFHENNLIKLNMAEFNSEHSVSKIIGASPGYVGYDNKSCFLDKLREKSFAVVLLEDIDKGNKKVLDIFRKALEDGYFTDSKGEKISIVNNLFFLTKTLKDSNLGFTKKDVSFNDDFSRVTTRIQFAEITEKVVDKYISDKLKISDINCENCMEELNKIKKEAKYQDFGLSLVDTMFEKFLIFSGIK